MNDNHPCNVLVISDLIHWWFKILSLILEMIMIVYVGTNFLILGMIN